MVPQESVVLGVREVVGYLSCAAYLGGWRGHAYTEALRGDRAVFDAQLAASRPNLDC